MLRTPIPLLSSCLVLACTAAANWPQFRGPAASGVVTGDALPTRWNLAKGENVRWSVPVPGLGHASPIVWDGRVYLATAVGPGPAELKVGLYGDIGSANDQGPHEWRLLAIDLRGGSVLWNTLAHTAVPRVKRHTKASHCNSTPATDGRRIAAILGSEGLFCFSMGGDKLWRRDLGPMDSGYFQSPSAQWGFASSPVLHGDRVLVLCDVQRDSFLAAFDAADGRELWRTPRKDVPTWGTPAVVRFADRAQVVVNGWKHTGGYDFSDGAEIWKLTEGGDIPVPTPVFAHDLIYLTSAHGRFRPIRAVRPESRGDITPPDPGATNAGIAWAHARLGNYMQTPLVVGDLLWACADNGVLTCMEAQTGTVVYSERLPSGQGYTASAVSDGRHLYFFSETGNAYVVPATRTFSVVSTNAMDETVMASPAIGGGSLLIRTRQRLVAVAP